MNKMDLNKSFIYNSILKMVIELNLDKIVQKNGSEKFLNIIEQQNYLKKIFYIKLCRLMFSFIKLKNYSDLKFRMPSYNVDFQNSVINFSIELNNCSTNKNLILHFFKEFNDKKVS